MVKVDDHAMYEPNLLFNWKVHVGKPHKCGSGNWRVRRNTHWQTPQLPKTLLNRLSNGHSQSQVLLAQKDRQGQRNTNHRRRYFRVWLRGPTHSQCTPNQTLTILSIGFMWQNIIVEFTGSFRRGGVETDEKRVTKILEIAWAWNTGNWKIGKKRTRFVETKCNI